jgi:hypothetical protein
MKKTKFKMKQKASILIITNKIKKANNLFKNQHNSNIYNLNNKNNSKFHVKIIIYRKKCQLKNNI